MDFTRRTWIALALVGAGAAASAGCRNEHSWHAEPVEAGGILIQSSRIDVTSVRLQYRGTVFNRGPVPIVVNRDAVTVTVADGRTVGRAQGLTSSVHVPYIIPPGGSHAVQIAFESEGFNFVRERGAQINWTGAISVNGQPVAVPPSIISE